MSNKIKKLLDEAADLLQAEIDSEPHGDSRSGLIQTAARLGAIYPFYNQNVVEQRKKSAPAPASRKADKAADPAPKAEQATEELK